MTEVNFLTNGKCNSPFDWTIFPPFWQDMLPEYIPMRVAESILFAGKAVRVLRNPTPAFHSDTAVYHQLPISFQKIQGLAERFPFLKEAANSQELGEDLLPQSEADKIEAMLLDLKVFHATVFYSDGVVFSLIGG